MLDTKNDLDIAFKEFEKEISGSREIRTEMINQLRKQITVCEITEYDKPMMITAKLEILKTLDGLLNSESDISLKKIKMKLARKSDEANAMVGASIVQLLKNIRVNESEGDHHTTQQDLTASMEQLSNRAKEIAEHGDEKAKAAITINDGELESCDHIASDAQRPPDEPTDDE